MSELSVLLTVLALSATSKLFLVGLPMVVALEMIDEIFSQGV